MPERCRLARCFAAEARWAHRASSALLAKRVCCVSGFPLTARGNDTRQETLAKGCILKIERCAGRNARRPSTIQREEAAFLHPGYRSAGL